LLAEEVAGHHFDVGDDGKTRVCELKRTERGVVMPPFNRELAKLSEEVLFLQDLLAEAGAFPGRGRWSSCRGGHRPSSM
jgi:hypothetical protein